MRIEVLAGDGDRVAAIVRGHRVETDQPERSGGDGSAPAPFDLFLASLATCGGFYAQRFCRARNIDPSGLRLEMTVERDPESKRLERLCFEVTLPEGFPEKYRTALVRSIDQCAVKKAIFDPPRIDVEVLDAGTAR